MTRGGKIEFFALRIRLLGLVAACGVIAAVATVLGFLGGVWWAFDLFAPFRVQLCLGLLSVALIFLARRRYKACALFVVPAVVNGCAIVPLFFGKATQPVESAFAHRALLLNVNTQSGHPEKVAQLIGQLDPDVIVLEEVNVRWLSSLAHSLKGYPHSNALPREDNFGIALYSKIPFKKSEIRQVGEAEIPSVVAELESSHGRFTLIATHPLPPGGAENSRLRNDQLARLPAIVEQAESPVLLLGDLNATPWCSAFKRLLRQSTLRDSSQGRGPLPTWPTHLPPLLIPIDHCLHSAGIQVLRKAIGPQVGSDHYPLIIDFVLTKR